MAIFIVPLNCSRVPLPTLVYFCIPGRGKLFNLFRIVNNTYQECDVRIVNSLPLLTLEYFQYFKHSSLCDAKTVQDNLLLVNLERFLLPLFSRKNRGISSFACQKMIIIYLSSRTKFDWQVPYPFVGCPFDALFDRTGAMKRKRVEAPIRLQAVENDDFTSGRLHFESNITAGHTSRWRCIVEAREDRFTALVYITQVPKDSNHSVSTPILDEILES